MNNWKYKFWIPFVAGFLVIPNQKSYLDSAFYENKYLPPFITFALFITYHIASITLFCYLLFILNKPC